MIKLENLSKEFKTIKKETGLKGAAKALFSRKYTITKAVDNISFSIAKGELVGYIGANGAGKSTTIKMISGILTPTSGTCSVNGLIPYKNRKQNAKNIGVVFGQRTQLWWDLPLSESFSILKEIYDVSDSNYKNRMSFLTEILGLNEFIKSPVRTLSLGQRMRADLAASLIHNPAVLFLDEPTIGLDVVVKEKIRLAIKQLNREYNTTVILTTHDMTDIQEICDRMIIIDKGKLIYDGSIEAIKKSYGYMRTVTLDLKPGDENIKIDIAKRFKLKETDAEIRKEAYALHIRFNRDKLNIADIVSYVQKKAYIVDISIQETEIEEIVRKIYNDGSVK